MTIYAAILTLALSADATGSASASMRVDAGIERIVLRIVAGGVKDVASGLGLRDRFQQETTWGEIPSVALRIDDTERTGIIAWLALPKLWQTASDNRQTNGVAMRSMSNVDIVPTRSAAESLTLPTLRIDGQPRTGIFAWLAAAHRVAGYCLDRRTTGSIEYSYRVFVRNTLVWRNTRITDDHVVLTTRFQIVEWVKIEIPRLRNALRREDKKLPPKIIWRKVPINVTIRIAATERGPVTLLAGTATGIADLSSFRCELIQRIAANCSPKEVSAGLADALGTLRTGGTKLYLRGRDALDANAAVEKIITEGLLR